MTYFSIIVWGLLSSPDVTKLWTTCQTTLLPIFFHSTALYGISFLSFRVALVYIRVFIHLTRGLFFFMKKNFLNNYDFHNSFSFLIKFDLSCTYENMLLVRIVKSNHSNISALNDSNKINNTLSNIYSNYLCIQQQEYYFYAIIKTK